MGNPPKRIVNSKLIRRYFKKQSNIFSEDAMKMKQELSKCWEQYGVDHPKCLHLIPKFDKGWAIDLNIWSKFHNTLLILITQWLHKLIRCTSKDNTLKEIGFKIDHQKCQSTDRIKEIQLKHLILTFSLNQNMLSERE